jgi:hypothetical protein
MSDEKPVLKIMPLPGTIKISSVATAQPLRQTAVTTQNSCGCAPASDTQESSMHSEPWISGAIDSPAGKIPVIKSALTGLDKWQNFRARVSSFRNSYTVRPGLYALGTPDSESDIFVSANYKMSFDMLRSSLSGINCWVLVLDTKGVNVWCAAGKGTFGTEELLRMLRAASIDKVVSHRRLIVPQLGAPGVNAVEVLRRSGFRVIFGPVRSEDIASFVKGGYKADTEMRRVTFPLKERLVLIPMELNPVLKKIPAAAAAFLIYSGLTPDGIIFSETLTQGGPLLAAAGLSALAGAVFTPAMLPYIPFRSFSVKGWISGMIFIAPLIFFTDLFDGASRFFAPALLIFFPLMSSYIALQFTGATTFTSLSGVKREIKIFLPLYIAAAVIAMALLVLEKISQWSYL